jgi:hypothetical protein
VVQSVLEGIDDPSLQVFVVWISAIRTDGYEAAIESRGLIPDPRVRHYWDGNQDVGNALAPVLKTQMSMAWDVYVAYRPGVKWESSPPEPAEWLHQKPSEGPARYLSGAKLEDLLRGISK